MFRRSTWRVDKWVLTANVTLLWQTDTKPGWFLRLGVILCVCEGKLILWQGHNLPCPLLICVWMRWVNRERKTEGGSWLNNSISTWVKLLILPKSSQRELKHTHTLKVSDCVSALNYITRGPTWVRSIVSIGHREAFRRADGPLIVRERSCVRSMSGITFTTSHKLKQLDIQVLWKCQCYF